jgi:hypothetical protein
MILGIFNSNVLVTNSVRRFPKAKSETGKTKDREPAEEAMGGVWTWSG